MAPTLNLPSLKSDHLKWILYPAGTAIFGVLIWLAVVMWSTRVAKCEVLNKKSFSNCMTVYTVKISPLALSRGSRYSAAETQSSYDADPFNNFNDFSDLPDEDIPDPFNATVAFDHSPSPSSNSSICDHPFSKGEMLSCFCKRGSSSPNVQLGKRWYTRDAARINVTVVFVLTVLPITLFVLLPMFFTLASYLRRLFERIRSSW